MMRWWRERTPRERLLLAVLAGLGAVALLLVLVVRPLQAARAGALADIRTYQTLSARLRAAGPATGPAPRTGTPAEIVASAATEAGLVAATAPAAGGVTATIADGPYDAVLRFVAATEATSALRLRRIAIVPGRAAGLVTARAEFAG